MREAWYNRCFCSGVNIPPSGSTVAVGTTVALGSAVKVAVGTGTVGLASIVAVNAAVGVAGAAARLPHPDTIKAARMTLKIDRNSFSHTAVLTFTSRWI